MAAINAHLALEKTLRDIADSGKMKRLLLHSCCGPCSSAVLERLAAVFDVTILYYNPNIYPRGEFEKRAAAQAELLARMNFVRPIRLVTPAYTPEVFDAATCGLEDEPEGGARCRRCFELRLSETARYAKEHGFDYFTTTLSVSPHKNAALLNQIGEALAEKEGAMYLAADFKKRNGYQRSVELSKQYAIYRQDYCGCRYSFAEKEKRT
ncbi:epoxyqueuosine reductase QueH [Oscillospiraceae bacterium CM]|nr:epoxyqueuosine reductase QueH [Oscillospiraceae bacterium CM]